MRLPILILFQIATAHAADLNLTATTGEVSNACSIAATALQNATAVVGTHGSDRSVLSRAGKGIPGKLIPPLIITASVLGGGLVVHHAASVLGGHHHHVAHHHQYHPSAMEAAGLGSRTGWSVTDTVQNFKSNPEEADVPSKWTEEDVKEPIKFGHGDEAAQKVAAEAKAAEEARRAAETEALEKRVQVAEEARKLAEAQVIKLKKRPKVIGKRRKVIVIGKRQKAKG